MSDKQFIPKDFEELKQFIKAQVPIDIWSYDTFIPEVLPVKANIEGKEVLQGEFIHGIVTEAIAVLLEQLLNQQEWANADLNLDKWHESQELLNADSIAELIYITDLLLKQTVINIIILQVKRLYGLDITIKQARELIHYNQKFNLPIKTRLATDYFIKHFNERLGNFIHALAIESTLAVSVLDHYSGLDEQDVLNLDLSGITLDDLVDYPPPSPSDVDKSIWRYYLRRKITQSLCTSQGDKRSYKDPTSRYLPFLILYDYLHPIMQELKNSYKLKDPKKTKETWMQEQPFLLNLKAIYKYIEEDIEHEDASTLTRLYIISKFELEEHGYTNNQETLAKCFQEARKNKYYQIYVKYHEQN